MAITVRSIPTRLAWRNFRQVAAIPGSSEEAQVNPETSGLERLRPERTTGGSFRLPTLTITVGLNAATTIVLRTANRTDALLKHEQGHFDLLVLVTRALARDLEVLDEASVDDLAARLQESRDLHNERAQAVDAAYDQETQHSRNTTEQTKWNTAIATALANPQASEVVGHTL